MDGNVTYPYYPTLQVVIYPVQEPILLWLLVSFKGFRKKLSNTFLKPH